jgi:hypothetical protein
MQQVRIPIRPISERTRLGNFPDVLANIIEVAERRGETVPTLLLFEPVKEGGNPAAIAASTTSALVVVTFGQEMRTMTFEALKRVEAREPEFPRNVEQKPPRLEYDASLKIIFREMAAAPMTVFSLTLSDDEDATTLFFVRTAFTVGELIRELEVPEADEAL